MQQFKLEALNNSMKMKEKQQNQFPKPNICGLLLKDDRVFLAPTGNAALPSIIKLNFEIELFRLFTGYSNFSANVYDSSCISETERSRDHVRSNLHWDSNTGPWYMPRTDSKMLIVD